MKTYLNKRFTVFMLATGMGLLLVSRATAQTFTTLTNASGETVLAMELKTYADVVQLLQAQKVQPRISAKPRNIVGYVNVALPANKYTFLANPLDNGAGNYLTNLIALPPDATRVYVWDVTNQTFLPPAVFSASAGHWSTNFTLPVGRGFVVYTVSSFTNTFVGSIIGSSGQPLTNSIPGNKKFTLIGSVLPYAGNFLTDVNLKYPKIVNGSVYAFPTSDQSYSDAYTYFTGSGWFNPKGSTLNFSVADAVFVYNPGPTTNWVQFIP